MNWADRVAAKVGKTRPWPEWNEKTEAIARRLVVGITTDPNLTTMLARRCYEEAARWWGRA